MVHGEFCTLIIACVLPQDEVKYADAQLRLPSNAGAGDGCAIALAARSTPPGSVRERTLH